MVFFLDLSLFCLKLPTNIGEEPLLETSLPAFESGFKCIVKNPLGIFTKTTFEHHLLAR